MLSSKKKMLLIKKKSRFFDEKQGNDVDKPVIWAVRSMRFIMKVCSSSREKV
jgi:hypothetical protein